MNIERYRRVQETDGIRQGGEEVYTERPRRHDFISRRKLHSTVDHNDSRVLPLGRSRGCCSGSGQHCHHRRVHAGNKLQSYHHGVRRSAIGGVLRIAVQHLVSLATRRAVESVLTYCSASVARLIWAFSKDNGLPTSHFFAHISPRFRVPLRALSLVATVCCLLSLINLGSRWLPSGTLNS